LARDGSQHVRVRYLGHVAGRSGMIGIWGPLSERAPLPAAPLVLARGVSCPVPGCSGA
jgi:hypothetical protein